MQPVEREHRARLLKVWKIKETLSSCNHRGRRGCDVRADATGTKVRGRRRSSEYISRGELSAASRLE